MTGRSKHPIVRERQEHRLERRFTKAEDSKGPWVLMILNCDNSGTEEFLAER